VIDLTPPRSRKGPREALAARGVLEEALDHIGWRWSRRISPWIDALVILDETIVFLRQRLDDRRGEPA
jgi:hypothetical protein